MKRQQNENDFEDLIMKEKPDVSWEEVVGLDDAKNALFESIVYPTKRPDLFPLGWPRGLLLYGPPGCGKTILGAATASEIDGYFINVDASALMSKWLGEAEKNVAGLFNMARSYAEKEAKVRSTELAKLFDGYSASDIRDICQAAQLKKVHELFNSGHYKEPIDGEQALRPSIITMPDFRNIMTRRKPSVSTEMIRVYFKWSEEFKAL